MSAIVGFPRIGYARTRGAPELFGQHPTVRENPHNGHAVSSLFLYGGVFMMGYGDWTANTGPVDLLGLDAVSAEPTVVYERALTESTEVFRVIGGDLYIPWIDTHSSIDSQGGGYITNSGGSWHEVVVPDLIHTFDIASTSGSDLVVAGSSRATNQACLKRSIDGGVTWVDITPVGAPPLLRLHSVVAPGNGTCYTLPWGTWSESEGWVLGSLGTSTNLNNIEAQRPILSGVHYSTGFCVDSGGNFQRYSPDVVPQAVSDGVLYGTMRHPSGSASVFRSSGITGGVLDWEHILNLSLTITAPSVSQTHSQRIEVHDGYVYVGGTQGRIWRYPVPE